MYSSSLKGIFPESSKKPVCKRNFIKENINSIKHMQGLLQEAGVIQSKQRNENTKRVFKTINSKNTHLKFTRCQSEDVRDEKSEIIKSSPVISAPPRITNIILEENEKITHRAMQTENDLSNLYDTGVIKYPSNCKGQGDEIQDKTKEIFQQSTKDKNFVEGNKLNIKMKPMKQNLTKVISEVPATYQRGVVPKYIQDLKIENEIEEKHEKHECPDGHVILPEEERKETLRVLRQSYADKIQELNMMPVRSDTLRIKKRKTEIEEELKKIDVGIKVFQRPKVYVKMTK